MQPCVSPEAKAVCGADCVACTDVNSGTTACTTGGNVRALLVPNQQPFVPMVLPDPRTPLVSLITSFALWLLVAPSYDDG